VRLERGQLSLVSTTEELLGRKNSGSGLENREYGRRDLSRRPRGTLYPQKLEPTSPTSGGRSVGIVRSLWALDFVFPLCVQSFFWIGLSTLLQPSGILEDPCFCVTGFSLI
jgi:hypothetical protein